MKVVSLNNSTYIRYSDINDKSIITYKHSYPTDIDLDRAINKKLWELSENELETRS